MIHVLPVNDIKEHVEDTTCECEPTIDFKNGIIVHNAFDGREHLERAKEILNRKE